MISVPKATGGGSAYDIYINIVQQDVYHVLENSVGNALAKDVFLEQIFKHIIFLNSDVFK